MKKLALKLEELAVESFRTAEEGGEARGTVRGHATVSCPGYSCAVTCGMARADVGGFAQTANCGSQYCCV